MWKPNESQNVAYNHTTKQNCFYVVDVPHNAKSHCVYSLLHCCKKQRLHRSATIPSELPSFRQGLVSPYSLYLLFFEDLKSCCWASLSFVSFLSSLFPMFPLLRLNCYLGNNHGSGGLCLQLSLVPSKVHMDGIGRGKGENTVWRWDTADIGLGKIINLFCGKQCLLYFLFLQL